MLVAMLLLICVSTYVPNQLPACRKKYFSNYAIFVIFTQDPCEDIRCSFNSLCVVDSNYKASCQCPKCPSTTKHVCGTDGRTYINECEVRKQSCTTKTNIRVLHPGKCSK